MTIAYATEDYLGADEYIDVVRKSGLNRPVEDRGRVERLALMDTQAAPDTPEASARRRGFIEQTRLGRFHGVQPSLLPTIVHRSRLNDQAVVGPILDMAGEVGSDGFCREQTAMIARPDSRRLLVEIDVPTVVIVGRQDQATPLSRAQEMATDIASAGLTTQETTQNVWFSHGLVCAPTNAAVTGAVASRGAAAGTMQAASTVLASRLDSSAALYDNTDQQQQGQIDGQMHPR